MTWGVPGCTVPVMDSLPKIDSDVPMPAPKYDYARALASMQVGQSFSFPPRDKTAVRRAARLSRCDIRMENVVGSDPRVWLLSLPGSSLSARNSRCDIYLGQMRRWAERSERDQVTGTAKIIRSLLPPSFSGGAQEVGRVLALLTRIADSGVNLISVDTKRGNTYCVDLSAMRDATSCPSTPA